MRILVTGSSGWLGQTLVPRLRNAGNEVIGLDLVPAQTTQIVGSVADRDLVRSTIRDFQVNAVIHSGALHKPNIETHETSAFVSANVQGTLNLLEESVSPGSKVDRFVFTSTTSLMISREIRAARSRNVTEALWIDEEMTPILPRNIYGVTKHAAEHLCRLFHQIHGLPVLILRTARFFPEEDDMAHEISQSGPNTKANELLFRRLSVEDAAESHVVAISKAPEIGFDTFIISAKTPFHRGDCRQLIADAPAVVERYFPHYRGLYESVGWTMFQRIDRVYDSGKASRILGFECRYGFKEMLDELAEKTGGRD
jgi:UDP-glucose 4-epimerase